METRATRLRGRHRLVHRPVVLLRTRRRLNVQTGFRKDLGGEGRGRRGLGRRRKEPKASEHIRAEAAIVGTKKVFVGSGWARQKNRNFGQSVRRVEGCRSEVRPKCWTCAPVKSPKTMSVQFCKKSHDVLVYIRAIQGHSKGDVIVPELSGHVAIPLR